MNQLNPYITFDGNCEEAMKFYASVLGGEPQIMTFRSANIEVDGVMHAALATPDGMHIFASDHSEGMPPLTRGNNVQVSISGNDDAALTKYFNGLSEGGQVLIPLEEQMWGDKYGQFADRFGILWHVNIAS